MRPFGRTSIAVLLSVAVAVAAGERARAEGTTVVLLEPADESDLARETIVRARAELAAGGFDVVVAKKTGTDVRTSLEDAIKSSGAVAAIAIEADPRTTKAEVWVSDRLTGKLSIRPVAENGNDSPSVVAVRAVELLRASLLELRDASGGAGGGAPDELPPPIEKLTAPPREKPVSGWRGFGIEAGVGGLFHTDPAKARVAPMFRLSYGSRIGVGARLVWIGPTFGPSLEGSLGNAVLTEEIGVAEIFYAPRVPRPLELSLSLGTGFYHVAASGDLKDEALSLSSGTTSFLGDLGVDAGVRIVDHFAIDVGVYAGLAAPRVVVDMGEQHLAALGRPLLGANLGLRASF